LFLVNKICGLGKMAFVYVVIENGEPYAEAYASYALAQAAVKVKWDEEVQRQREEEGDVPNPVSDIDLPEDPSGETYLYVEKGNHIRVYRMPVKATGGGKRKSRRGRQ